MKKAIAVTVIGLSLVATSVSARTVAEIVDGDGLTANYHGQSDTIQYNSIEHTFDRVQPGDTLQYNPHTTEYQYHQPGYTPMYNPYTQEWE